MHIPVLCHEAISYLNPCNGGIYIDATFGGGGYTQEMLHTAECKVIAFDRDLSVSATADAFKNKFGERFEFIHDTFSNVGKYAKKLDGMVADFGISSMHVDEASRGFSFQQEAKLDMRMGKCEFSAFEVVNEFSEERLAEIIFKYSNERLANKIASVIFHERKMGIIQTTTHLAKVIYKAYGMPKRYKIHPATKTFQAIRVFVNDELAEIETFLKISSKLLQPKSRLVCVSFHELEDRLVKNFFTEHSLKKIKHNKYAKEERDSTGEFKIITKKPIAPSVEEVKINPRSRSAKLRCAEKN